MTVAILIIVCVIAAVIIMGKKKTSPQVTPTPTPAPGKRPAPFYGKPITLDAPRYGRGQRIVLNAMPETHGCDAGVGYAAQTQGIFDNGSGPYRWRVDVHAKRTGVKMPIYQWLGQLAGVEVTGQILAQSEMVCFYCFGKRPWSSLGTLGSCNEFTPLPEYLAEGEAKTTVKACATCPTPSPAPTTSPTLPAELLAVDVTVWNADDVSAEYHYEVLAETRNCS